MLNKNLLMLTGGETEWYTKLTVGKSYDHCGYSTDKNHVTLFGSMSEEPSWTFKGESCPMWAFTTYKNDTILYINNSETIKSYFSEITVTVVEKKLTLTFKGTSKFGYSSQTVLFTPDDVGKTFTIGFDPPPGSYA